MKLKRDKETKEDGKMNETVKKKVLIISFKIISTLLAAIVSLYAALFAYLSILGLNITNILSHISAFILPSLLLPLIWLKKRKKFLIVWCICFFVYGAALGTNIGIINYNQSITVNTTPSIDVYEYLPFTENSKIVKTDSKTLKITENLPVIDGAAAVFPVYSAFVNAVYPNTVKLFDGVFEYNNTPSGYRLLAEKKTDIFIGAYPSEEQREYAKENQTTFEYTPIGTEAFVFFVHKDNPVTNLTTEQIKGIYSGKIKNWKEVGGKNQKIDAFQRNEGSGSQSMLKRFMGDTPIMKPNTEQVVGYMWSITEQVENYKNKKSSIGFSFRYYIENIVQNPDLKIISVDGIAPTCENIRNASYNPVTPLYAVTHKEDENENVKKLLDWILSDEGQYIINETGYVAIKE